MTEWFRRKSKNITTPNRREIAEGLWVKCFGCNQVIYNNTLMKNNYVCLDCSYHFRMPCDSYINLLIDDNNYNEIGPNIESTDPLTFNAKKKYSDQLSNLRNNNNDNRESIKVVNGEMNGIKIVLGVMNFSFIGGSMGSVLGEKISRAIDYAKSNTWPLIIISASGGARMQEGVYSLMQLAKISTKLAEFSNFGGIYISLLTDPTYGGATASFAMQGDIILAEPNALIGFAGKRVIRQTIGEELPENFQMSFDYRCEHLTIPLHNIRLLGQQSDSPNRRWLFSDHPRRLRPFAKVLRHREVHSCGRIPYLFHRMKSSYWYKSLTGNIQHRKK